MENLHEKICFSGIHAGFCSPPINSFTAESVPIYDASGNCTIPKYLHRCPNICTISWCDCLDGECKVKDMYIQPKQEDMQFTTLAILEMEVKKSLAYLLSKEEELPNLTLAVTCYEDIIERIKLLKAHEQNCLKKSFLDGQIDANKQQFAIGLPKMADDYFKTTYNQNDSEKSI